VSDIVPENISPRVNALSNELTGSGKSRIIMTCDSALLICDATESDAAEILRIQKAAFLGQGMLYNDMSLPPLVQKLDELMQDFKNYSFLKALYNGKIVGSVRGHIETDTCHVSRLFVHPDFQNRGIGKKLLLAVEDKFIGAKRFELFTGHKSERNIALYEKLGYRKFRERPQGNNVTLYCMEKWRD
jgi:ribosomal protein S18 acetylase RimI-like enzyme